MGISVAASAATIFAADMFSAFVFSIQVAAARLASRSAFRRVRRRCCDGVLREDRGRGGVCRAGDDGGVYGGHCRPRLRLIHNLPFFEFI